MRRMSKALLSLAAAAMVGVGGWASIPATSESQAQPAPPSEPDLHAAVIAAAIIDTAAPVPDVPDVPGYERGCSSDEACSFGPAWTDDHAGLGGHDGCDSRNNILASSLSDVVFKPGTHECVVLSGTNADPYLGETVQFSRSEASEIHIDHVVPLARSWNLGASDWSIEKRIAFANDQELNLLAVDGATNQSKSDKGLDEWLPPNEAFRCEYAARYLQVSNKYDLALTVGDIAAASAACGLHEEKGQ